MAWALTQKCIEEGVTKNLRQVGVCSTEELVILEQVRMATCQKIDGCPSVQFGSSVVSLGDNSKCHNCGIKQDCLFLPLLPCHCSEAFYHSYACKSKHREQHLEACMWACDFNHHVSIAPFRQAARILMKSLQLDFGKSKESARLVVFRLILTGQDTPQNWMLLFGSNGGLGSSFEDTREIYQAARIKCLLAPPLGSPAYRDFACLSRCHLGGKPRPARNDEEFIIRQVRGMQHYIRRRFKSVSGKITPTWMVLDSIMRGFQCAEDGLKDGPKNGRKTRTHIFNLAIDTMKLPPVGDEGA